ncbi:MAG TPA: cupin domain-containing protein [Longimicrobiales bacterium]
MIRIRLDDIADEGVSHDPEIRKRVMIRNGRVPHVTTFAQSRFRPGQAATTHAHPDMYEIFLVESGTGVVRIDGREFPLEPGVCVVIEPGERHDMANTGTEDLVLTYFGIAE